MASADIGDACFIINVKINVGNYQPIHIYCHYCLFIPVKQSTFGACISDANLKFTDNIHERTREEKKV